MNYLAYFTTVEDDRSGNFSMVVEAIDIDTAIDKFKNEILKQKDSGDIFSDTGLIYLEDILEIEKFPVEAQIVKYESRKTEFHAIIGFKPIDVEGIKSFSWYPDDKEENDEEIHPFLIFEKSKKG